MAGSFVHEPSGGSWDSPAGFFRDQVQHVEKRIGKEVADGSGRANEASWPMTMNADGPFRANRRHSWNGTIDFIGRRC
jgi:hypothetical protein